MGKYFDRRTKEGKAAELWSNIFSFIGSFIKFIFKVLSYPFRGNR